MVKRVSWIMIATGLLIAMLVAPAAFAQEAPAQVRVVHASPDAPAVDVYVNGDVVLEGVEFFAASDYLELPAGEYRFQVAPAGTSADDAVIDATATLAAGQAYTVAATGLLADITATILADDLSAPAEGSAKIRVIHASPDAPGVDIRLTGGDTLVSNLTFPNASDYLEVPAGSYDIEVVPAGADDVVIDLGGTNLAANTIYDVFATGALANIAPEVVTTTPAAPAPAAAPEAPAEAAPEAPAQLPVTSGEAAPLALFGFAAALLIAGGLLVRRFVR